MAPALVDRPYIIQRAIFILRSSFGGHEAISNVFFPQTRKCSCGRARSFQDRRSFNRILGYVSYLDSLKSITRMKHVFSFHLPSSWSNVESCTKKPRCCFQPRLMITHFPSSDQQSNHLSFTSLVIPNHSIQGQFGYIQAIHPHHHDTFALETK